MKPTRRSSLFLLELMIAILLFILAASVCIQVFVKSHTIEAKSTELNHAVLVSSSVAEILRSNEDYEELLQAEYPDCDFSNDTYSIYYDTNWKICSSADSSYVLTLHISNDSKMLTGDLSVKSESDVIYELEVKKHIHEEGNSND